MEAGARQTRLAAREFATSNDFRGWVELIITLSIYGASFATMLLSIGNWFILVPAVIVNCLMTLRLYMIQHDCIHRSFYKSRMHCDIVGTVLSPLVMTPYRATRYKHNLHHAHVANLERRDTFEIYVMTLEEWQNAGFWKRLGYRIYRSPFTLVMVGPFVMYLILRRFPLSAFKTGIVDIVVHNAAIVGILYLIWLGFGAAGLWVWLATVYLTSSLGALIPYIVHNFEDVRWGVRPDMDFQTGALEGSAVLDWGRFFDLVSLNIGYHDLHHLNSKIPGYRLKEAHFALVEKGLLEPERIGFLEGLSCFRWKLYDSERSMMVPFPRLFSRNSQATQI